VEANPFKPRVTLRYCNGIARSDPVADQKVWGRAAVSFQARIYSGGQELFSAVLLCAAIVFARDDLMTRYRSFTALGEARITEF